MNATTDVEPYQYVSGGERRFPWFMLPFDKHGRCKGPRTRDAIVRLASDPSVTDVFIFSHGWNNDWNVATKRYSDFIAGYTSLRQQSVLPLNRDFNPVLVGVFWPSTALVFGRERGIAIAAGDVDEDVLDAQERDSEVAALADTLDGSDVDRFYELVDLPELTDAEGRELAKMLAPVLDGGDGEFEGPAVEAASKAVEVEAEADLIRRWRELSDQFSEDTRTPEEVSADFWDFDREDTDESSEVPSDDLKSAGILEKLDPRQIVRLSTVRLMKDRAGTVGALGVGPFLVALLEATRTTNCRVHLIGHSYGAKVCLSALCYPSSLQRPVDSVLLLQPAISHRCFADDTMGRGGYADAPRRVEQPILATFSEHDSPLRKFFPLAIWRHSDKDELKIAADGEPGRFAALGGYGPRGLSDRSRLIDIKLPTQVDGARYLLGDGAPEVYGINATETISGHGDISNPSTWWALDNLVTAPRKSSR